MVPRRCDHSYMKSEGEKTAIQSSVAGFCQPYSTVTVAVSPSCHRQLKILSCLHFILFLLSWLR